jgi:hypothetical protein
MWHTWERREIHTQFWSEILKGRDHLEYVGTDGRILERILRKRGGGCKLDALSSGQGLVMGTCEQNLQVP